jgi:heme/copper-type cytochrome/quinol oxidase subunit 1
MGIFIAGFSFILTGLNFIVIIRRLRASGLTSFRLPLFIWSYYATSILFVLATDSASEPVTWSRVQSIVNNYNYAIRNVFILKGGLELWLSKHRVKGMAVAS